jgi:hypothetical protein
MEKKEKLGHAGNLNLISRLHNTKLNDYSN